MTKTSSSLRRSPVRCSKRTSRLDRCAVLHYGRREMAFAPEADIGCSTWRTRIPCSRRSAERKSSVADLDLCGLDFLRPFELLRERGVVVTNGAGINAVTIC